MDFFLKDDFIKLGQVLKAVGWASTGSDAKEMILSGEVKVNGEVSLQRGKKVVAGDIVRWKDREITVKAHREA